MEIEAQADTPSELLQATLAPALVEWQSEGQGKISERKVRVQRSVCYSQGNCDANDENSLLQKFVSFRFKILKLMSLGVKRQAGQRGKWAGSLGSEQEGSRPPTVVCHPYRGQCGTSADRIQGRKTAV